MPVILFVLGLMITALLIPGVPRRIARCVVLWALCLVFLPVSIIVGVAGWTVRLTLLEPSFHLAVLKEVDMYDAIPEVVSGMAVMHLDNIARLKAAERESVANALRAAVSESISPAWVEGEITRLVAGSLKFLKGGGSPPDLSVSMSALKTGMMEKLSTGNLPAPVLAEARKIVSAIPDRLYPPGVESGRSAGMLLPARPGVQLAMSAGPVAVLAGVAILFSAWLIAGRGGAFPLWAGSGCLVGGIAVLALTVVGRMYLLQATGRLLLPAPFSSLPLQAWVEAAVLRLLGTTQIGGGIVVTAGAMLVALPRLTRRAPATTGE